MHFIADAPGRMDIMGGFADYSGSLVLQKTIKNKTTARYLPGNDGWLAVQSITSDGNKLSAVIDLSSLLPYAQSGDFKALRAKLKTHETDSWILYITGCFLLAHLEKRIPLLGGELMLESTVPLGKGVSSSASLEVAVLRVLQKAFDIHFVGNELPILAQKVENQVAGAPCGLMDQLACYHGHEQALLPILCQPDKVYPSIDIPENVHFIGIDSGERHAIEGASYTDVRVAAFMGLKIILHHLGYTNVNAEIIQEGTLRNDLPLKGYLANLNTEKFETDYLKLLPETLTGKDFLLQYGDHIDSATEVESDTDYKVKAATSHPVFENERVKMFIESINSLSDIKHSEKTVLLNTLGRLMSESHRGYQLCGQNSKGTDKLVQLAQRYRLQGVYGAKITGGGSGGTVCFLAHGQEGWESVLEIKKLYEQSIGRRVDLLY